MPAIVRCVYDCERMKTWHKIAIGVALIAIVGLFSMTIGVNTFFTEKATPAHAAH
jgi:hypothetical protein